MTEDKKPRVWTKALRPSALWFVAIFAAWWTVVVASGLGWGFGVQWDFSTTGELGDSFGILGALMASLAAYFTYQTLQDTRAQAALSAAEADAQRVIAEEAKQEALDEREKSERRDAARDKADARRDNEGTYFRLLELRFRVLADLRTGPKDRQVQGTDAAAEYLRMITRPSGLSVTPEQYPSRYKLIYSNYHNDLGHYFRFTYHIIKFARESFNKDAYKYIRLLRAQLSNAELALIALNCAHGEGRTKFLPWAERYSLFHNLEPKLRLQLRLDDFIKPRAFDPEALASLPPMTHEAFAKILADQVG